MRQRILSLTSLFVLIQGISHEASGDQEIYDYWKRILQIEKPIAFMFDELWLQIHPNIPKILPEAKKSFHPSNLLYDTDFAVLLWRIITTDYLVFDVIPRILLVRQQNSQYFSSVTYPQIRELIGRYTPTFSVGTQTLGFR